MRSQKITHAHTPWLLSSLQKLFFISVWNWSLHDVSQSPLPVLSIYHLTSPGFVTIPASLSLNCLPESYLPSLRNDFLGRTVTKSLSQTTRHFFCTTRSRVFNTEDKGWDVTPCTLTSWKSWNLNQEQQYVQILITLRSHLPIRSPPVPFRTNPALNVAIKREALKDSRKRMVCCSLLEIDCASGCRPLLAKLLFLFPVNEVERF